MWRPRGALPRTTSWPGSRTAEERKPMAEAVKPVAPVRSRGSRRVRPARWTNAAVRQTVPRNRRENIITQFKESDSALAVRQAARTWSAWTTMAGQVR